MSGCTIEKLAGRGGAASVVFDLTGTVYDPDSGGVARPPYSGWKVNEKGAHKVSVFAILRVELDVRDPEQAVAVKEVLPTVEEAEEEVQRLNRLNADKNCRYIWRATRFYPDGRRSPDDSVDV